MACRLILFQTSVRRTRKDPESLHKETGRIRKGPEGGRDRQEFRKDSGKSLKKKLTIKIKMEDIIMVPARRRYNQTWLPDIFNDFFDTDWMERMNATAPAINVLENENSYDLELAAPGLTRDDFKVHVNDEGNLVIEMEKKTDEKSEKKHGHYLRREFSYSQFQQTMVLPENADKENISAHVENGVLNVNIPKIQKTAEESRKVIEVK